MSGDERGMRQAFIRHLVANLQCVGCGEKYVRNDIYVLGHHEDIWVSAVVCSRCGTQGLVFATLRDEEHFEITSESPADETVILEKMPVLSVDDVLDVHAFLREFRGDMHALFRSGNKDG
jgi:hypothetical protein